MRKIIRTSPIADTFETDSNGHLMVSGLVMFVHQRQFSAPWTLPWLPWDFRQCAEKDILDLRSAAGETQRT